MIPLAIKLFLAHLMGDFLFQPEKWVNDKRKNIWKSKYLYLHIGVHAAALLLLLQSNYLIGIGVILISHYAIDILKLKFSTTKNEQTLFIMDQLAHLAVLAGVTYYYQPFALNMAAINNPQFLLFLVFFILVTKVFSICMKFFMSPWTNELELVPKEPMQLNKESFSLKNAGNYIGMLERLFVFGFIVLGQWAAIGFLITAKSVFRFGDLSQAKDRKLTEYVLIGTLLSFGLAIAAGLLYSFANAYLASQLTALN